MTSQRIATATASGQYRDAAIRHLTKGIPGKVIVCEWFLAGSG